MQQQADEIVRTLLIEHIAWINLRTKERTDQIAGHLADGTVNGVLGALVGAEEDIASMRLLSILIRNGLSTTKRETSQ